MRSPWRVHTELTTDERWLRRGVPAQALAQVCEVAWQLWGRAEGRQADGARVGITANQGLFGHGSSVILSV